MLQGRYEFKFPISIQQKEAIFEMARDSVVEDPHGQKAIYRVSSQYFDTEDFFAYWQKIDGEAIRKKFRLRYYTLHQSGEELFQAAFMEIKHRINNTVYKERIQLTREGAQKILSDSNELLEIANHTIEKDQSKKETIEKIVRAAQVPGFSAVNVISYLREAWLGKHDQRLRMTFDSLCRASTPLSFLDVGSEKGVPVLESDRCIMEIKFDRAIPRWVRDIVAKNGIRLQRFSKYAEGVNALDLCQNKERHAPAKSMA